MANSAGNAKALQPYQFKPGNKAGGNAYAGQIAKAKKEFFKAVQKGDIKQIVEKLIFDAKSGNIAAIKILLEYVIGKPKDDTTVTLDTGNQNLVLKIVKEPEAPITPITPPIIVPEPPGQSGPK